MKIELELTDIEYKTAQKFARLAGNATDYSGIVATLKDILYTESLKAKTPLGTISAWLTPNGGDDSETVEAGVLFTPDLLDGESIDLACAIADEEKVETRVYKDIMTEDFTDSFAFSEADFRRANGE